MACKYKSRVWENGWCNVACRYCTLTEEDTCKHNHQANGDRIRAMSDEELADFLLNFFVENMDINGIPHEEVTEADKAELLKQLQQPAGEDAK